MDQAIRMVDLVGQYARIKEEVTEALATCMNDATFINGPQVQAFSANISAYLGNPDVIPCANGTDALQIALMALGLVPGDEVIVPAFTYVATAEVIGLLGLTPVLVDVDPHTFNTTAALIEAAITPKTKAMVPVHLFGQCCDMEAIMALSKKTGIPVVEDTAQSLGSHVIFADGSRHAAGTIGAIGCTSFFPSKNLGAFGDGGAMFTRDAELAATIRMIANHGQSKRYYHDRLGVNSRLDSMQAAILNIKLRHLDGYNAARRRAADVYDAGFADLEELETPFRAAHSEHVFHQYTLKVKDGRRDELQAHLAAKNIPSMIYYPVPLQEQLAFKDICVVKQELKVANQLCKEVIS
ncbi:MAG: DegT/DnrJ/EryC1/StrS family aminotransferase, partial [Bacteroidia bacterium]|nr:DegT/DnrJ/EryC1/StrS family aminotransferase [Bacteroidia bacterium]